MPVKFKKLNRGISKYRGGRASKTGKRLKISNHKLIPTIGTKQLKIEGFVQSEHPSNRRSQASDQRSKIGKKTNKNPRGKYSYDGKSPPATKYKVTVVFNNVSFKEEKDDKHTVPVTFRGKQYYFERPDMDDASVQLKCLCPDYRHSYEWYNAKKEKGNVGNPRTYTRVTPARKGDPDDKKTYERPKNPKNPNPYGHDFVNPKGYVGYCKHIFNFRNFLLDSGYVK